jgi:hypothetical protein
VVPKESLFALYDLLRTALIDFRVASFFAESTNSSTIMNMLAHVNELDDDAPYNLRIVALQLACNLFGTRVSSTLAETQSDLISVCITLTSKNLLDAEHDTARVAAAGVAFNIAATNQIVRAKNGKESMSQDGQVELAAALIEALSREEKSKDTLSGLVMALGLLVYMSPLDGDVVELLGALEVDTALETLKKKKLVEGRSETEAVGIIKASLRKP